MKLIQQAAATALCLALTAPAFASEVDNQMLQLATESGCLACHKIDPANIGEKDVGPSWREVAARYHNKPGAQDFLTRIVLEGSNPYNSHWQGRASGVAMPPNAVAITEGNARLLVSWILSLND